MLKHRLLVRAVAATQRTCPPYDARSSSDRFPFSAAAAAGVRIFWSADFDDNRPPIVVSSQADFAKLLKACWDRRVSLAHRDASGNITNKRAAFTYDDAWTASSKHNMIVFMAQISDAVPLGGKSSYWALASAFRAPAAPRAEGGLTVTLPALHRLCGGKREGLARVTPSCVVLGTTCGLPGLCVHASCPLHRCRRPHLLVR